MRRLFLLCLLILLGFSRIASASVERDVDLWLQLRDTSSCYNFSLYRSLIDNRSDWPEQSILRVQAEQALTDAPPSNATILSWFEKHPPLGDNGKFLYFKTLLAESKGQAARNFLNASWADGAFNADQQDAIRSTYGNWISADANNKRLDKLLWDNNTKRAEKALTYVTGINHAIGRTRLALQRFDGRALTAVNAISSEAQRQSGFLYDLTRYYRQKNQDMRATQTLARHRVFSDHPAHWWKERSILARRALENGDFRGAYNLAASHGFSQGSELADAEWLAGWLAVSRLNDPNRALKHFDRMYRNVKTPISVARASYWAGIASAKAGNTQNATQWYRLAAQHMHTFYGQMAAYALGDASAHYAAFFKRSRALPSVSGINNSLSQAAAVLYRKGREKERDIFLNALLAQNADAPHKIIPLARQLHSPKISLAAAKAAYEKGAFIAAALFPHLTVPKNAEVEPALTLGIIRQESMFDPYAQSSARAMGLMQLLPGTASHVARRNGLAHRSTTQLFDPHHNMVLGQAYLGSMLNRYGGDVPLAAAAYNAGPGNVDNWVAEMGDPSADEYSWIDWVERIPFYETRNYVQRVWESYQIYKYMNGTRTAQRR